MDTQHKWSYCKHCNAPMVICGYCGNNCCNGSSGRWDFDTGEHIPCQDKCNGAYALQRNWKTAPLHMRVRANVENFVYIKKRKLQNKIRKLSLSRMGGTSLLLLICLIPLILCLIMR